MLVNQHSRVVQDFCPVTPEPIPALATTMAIKSSATASMLLVAIVVCACCGSVANAEVATQMTVASSAAQPTDAPKRVARALLATESVAQATRSPLSGHPGRRLLQACGRDSIECKSWGPSQCDRPGVPDNCPCMCGSGSGAGGSGGPPTIVINNANTNNNENIATGGNAKGGSASTRGLLQTPNNQNSGAIGGNAVSGDATGNNARSGDARGGDARIDKAMTSVDSKIDTRVNAKLFGKRKLLDNASNVMPSTRGLLQTPNNQNRGAIGGNAVSGDAKGDNSRTGDARGGDARIDEKMTKVDTKVDTKVNGKLFGKRKLLDNASNVMPSTRGLLQTPNNQNRGAIGGNAVSGDAIGDNSRTGDARGGDARIDEKMTKVDTKIDTRVNNKLFG